MQPGDELVRVRTFVGATRQLRLLINDASGSARDLSSYSTAKVSARIGTTYYLTRDTVTIEDAGSTGYVNFTPDAGELTTAGDMRAQIKFETAGGAIDFSDEFIIEVMDPIDSA